MITHNIWFCEEIRKSISTYWLCIRLVIRKLRVQPSPGPQHSFMEIDQEIVSTVILSLPLIQEGQLSVSGERICTILVNHLEE